MATTTIGLAQRDTIETVSTQVASWAPKPMGLIKLCVGTGSTPCATINVKKKTTFTHRPGVAGATTLDAAATGQQAGDPRNSSAELVLDPRTAGRNSLRRLNLVVFKLLKQKWHDQSRLFEAARISCKLRKLRPIDVIEWKLQLFCYCCPHGAGI